MYVIGEHYDYLHYSLLGYVINLYGSTELKQKMAEYVWQVESFRKETRLEVFSEVCDDEPEKINGRFAMMVTKHEMDWKTATLEDVERFRIQVCRELSLYDLLPQPPESGSRVCGGDMAGPSLSGDLHPELCQAQQSEHD